MVIVMTFALINGNRIVLKAVNETISVVNSSAPFTFVIFERFWFSFAGKRSSGNGFQQNVDFLQRLFVMCLPSI